MISLSRLSLIYKSFLLKAIDGFPFNWKVSRDSPPVSTQPRIPSSIFEFLPGPRGF